MRVGDAGLAWRKAVSGLVQPRVSGARIARTLSGIGADPGEAAEAAAAAAVPPAAAPFIRTAAVVVGLGDIVTRDRGFGASSREVGLGTFAG